MLHTTPFVQNATNAPRPSVWSPFPLTYHNGSSQAGYYASFNLVFWEPSTLQDGTPTHVSPTYNSLLQQFFTDLGSYNTPPTGPSTSSPLAGLLSQYPDQNGTGVTPNISLASVWVDTSPYPASGCANSATPHGCLTDAQIQAEIAKLAVANNLPHVGDVLVFTSWGEGSCLDSSSTRCAFSATNPYCAYHGYDLVPSIHGTLDYATIPYPGTAASSNCSVPTSPNHDPDADSAINLSSIEASNIDTDPLLNGWYDASTLEVGDKCFRNFGRYYLDNGLANIQLNGNYYLLQQEWNNKTNSCALYGPGSATRGNVYLVTSGALGSIPGGLEDINVSSGNLIWRYQAGGKFRTTPVVGNTAVYAGADDGFLYALASTNGILLWRYQTGGVIASTPALTTSGLYFGSADGFVYALNPDTGALLWRYQTGGAISAAPTVSNGVVYIGSDDTYIYALGATTGSLLWRYQTGGPVRSTSTVANGAVYVGSNDTYEYALNATSSALLWRYQTANSVTGGAAVGSGAVYFCSTDGNLYAVNTSTAALLWKDILQCQTPLFDGTFVYTGGFTSRGSTPDGTCLFQLRTSDGSYHFNWCSQQASIIAATFLTNWNEWLLATDDGYLTYTSAFSGNVGVPLPHWYMPAGADPHYLPAYHP